MNEIEKNSVGASSISKAAKLYDDMSLESTVQGIKAAASLEKQISGAEKSQKESEANPVIKEEVVPTGTEIEQDLKAGKYREIIEQPEKEQDREI